LEGRTERKRRLRELWHRLPAHHPDAPAKLIPIVDHAGLTPERAKELQRMYEDELLERCRGQRSARAAGHIGWREFKEYAQSKEAGMCLICPQVAVCHLVTSRTMVHISRRTRPG
jgi:solute carrier family 25 phosphate transporter 23/24/25/41